jgi:hypothetical protein
MFESALDSKQKRLIIMAKKNTTTDATPKKGGKSGKTRSRRGFWDRALQAPKVREALASLSVSEEKFEKAYSLTRKARSRGEMSDTVKAALAAFPEHRSVAKFAEAIAKSNLTAGNILSHALETGLLKLA